YLIYFYETDETAIKFDVFKNMAKNTTCADITNKLFIIDNQIVFWTVEGNCPDASYSYTLFGNNPDKILCKRYDSIAGPQEQCNNDNYQEIFQIIIDNIDADNLGLDAYHKVSEISF
ncbi:hypothetical protein ACFL1L_04865, partial [Thermoplasmatota archaeon]